MSVLGRAAALALAVACGEGAPAPRFETGGPVADWAAYGRDEGGSRFSPLEEITRQNVGALEIAWIHHTGDVSDDSGRFGRWKSSFQATPIVVDGTLYVSTALNSVIALDPETGVQRWRWNADLDFSKGYSESASRGVSSWLDGERAPGAPCRRRLFLGTLDARLVSLDAATGTPCADFGTGGELDLRKDVGPAQHWEYLITSPPAVIQDRVVVGSAIADNQRTDAPRGIVRAFDARTGALLWSFDPIPRDPADPAAASWEGESAISTGAANAWSILSADPERGLVFVPTGSASPDYWGGARRGDNLYANSVVALRAATGEVAWAFQAVHHDLWDYDVPAQPVLATLRSDGQEIPVVLQATKMGHLFVLHRETGVPVFPVEERPVPQSDVPGEASAPTQPFPTRPPPLATAQLRPEDAFGITPWDRGRCRQRIAALRHEGMFTPPSLEGTLVYPSHAGGTNWGSVAFDAGRQLVVLNQSRVPFAVRLIPRADYEARRAAAQANPLAEFAPQRGTPFAMERGPVLSPLGIPCSPPPWGTLLAVDLARGELRWEVPLGTTRDLAPIPIPMLWGTPNLGGPIVTASGVVFVAAAMDDYLRAFDVETGAELWRGRLPAGGQATPMTFRLREDGRQYVVIAAGGHGRLGTKLGDSLVAFALPGAKR